MKIAICAIIKDEHRYLKEWIDYHLGIGFSHIYLFEDYGSKSHEEIVRGYKNVSLYSVEGIGVKRDTSRQVNTYSYALEQMRGKEDWCAFFDIDEFLELDGISLENFLSQFNDANGVYVYWEYRDANGLIDYEDRPVRERFKRISTVIPNSEQAWSFKSIVNVNADSHLENPHKVIGGVNTMKIKTERCRCYYQARLAHYYTKSWEEWCMRFVERGDVSDGHRKIEDFFYANPDMNPKKQELIAFYYGLWFKKCPDNDYQVVADISNNISSVITCKCACSTIAYLCAEYNHAIHTCDVHEDARKFFKHNSEGKTLFCVYRDPVSRFLSFYNNKIKEDHTNWVRWKHLENASIDDTISACEYSIANDEPLMQDPHVRRQVDTYPVGDIDIIVPIEYLDDFLRENGITPPPHQNVSKGEKPTLTPEQEERIKKLYAADYELLKSPKVWRPNNSPT